MIPKKVVKNFEEMENIKIEVYKIGNFEIAELTSRDDVVTNSEDGSDLVGNLYYHGAERVIVYEHNLAPTFFDLKSGLAGDILQKFSNYRLRLVIVGDFSAYTSNSLQDFIRESNKGRQVNFVKSKEEAIEVLSN